MESETENNRENQWKQCWVFEKGKRERENSGHTNQEGKRERERLLERWHH